MTGPEVHAGYLTDNLLDLANAFHWTRILGSRNTSARQGEGLTGNLNVKMYLLVILTLQFSSTYKQCIVSAGLFGTSVHGFFFHIFQPLSYEKTIVLSR